MSTDSDLIEQEGRRLSVEKTHQELLLELAGGRTLILLHYQALLQALSLRHQAELAEAMQIERRQCELVARHHPDLPGEPSPEVALNMLKSSMLDCMRATSVVTKQKIADLIKARGAA